MSFSHIFTVVVPVFLIILVGYGTGRLRLFDAGGTKALRDLTMQLALPASLLLSIWKTPRHTLVEKLPLAGLLALGFLVVYAVLFLVIRHAARTPLKRAALLALACVQPQYAFMGTSILAGLFGAAQAAIPIAVAGILVNVILDPAVLVMLGLPDRTALRTGASTASATTRTAAPKHAMASSTATAGGGTAVAVAPVDIATDTVGTAPEPPRPSALQTVVHQLREPFVLGPLLGLLLSVVGVGVPEVVGTSLNLLASAASSAALLYVGLSVSKVGRPRLYARVWVISLISVVVLPLLLYYVGKALTSSENAAQAALILAFPVSPVPLMFASKYGDKADEETIGSAVVVSLVLSFITLPVIINLVG
ncbi:AEC family transporter [Streptomyces sp. CRN 30]|uniref:AEC family transporter n=1 Tax=Streptomyces sp. CRN 30 TaxID=3075613 RepID=UPI002A837335|nr:AEC family transporter [Streptomyces sp. CRN 30]